jgi:hypothetical protein
MDSCNVCTPGRRYWWRANPGLSLHKRPARHQCSQVRMTPSAPESKNAAAGFLDDLHAAVKFRARKEFER